jgi:hypothetical protein
MDKGQAITHSTLTFLNFTTTVCHNLFSGKQGIFLSKFFGKMNDRRFSVQRIGYYKVTRKDVGSGHFAKVVEALHRPTQVKCAIKIIDLEKVRASSYLSKNLTRESEILSKLHHPGIVQLFEVAEVMKMKFH